MNTYRDGIVVVYAISQLFENGRKYIKIIGNWGYNMLIKKVENICRMLSVHYYHRKKIWTAVFYLLTALLIFMLYNTVGLYADDILYMERWNIKEGQLSLLHIFQCQKEHYLSWSGRCFAHSILQILLTVGKPIASLANTISWMLLGYTIMKLTSKKPSIFLQMTIMSMLYYINPIFQETILWQTGNANYMWTTLVILATIYFFLNEGHIAKYITVPFSFLAGCSNENMSTTMIFVMIIIVLKNKTGGGAASKNGNIFQ